MFLLNLPNSLEKLSGTGIIYEPGLCTRVRFIRSKCEFCLQGCSVGAISWNKTLELDRYKCTNCGICISCCPNGVFWSRRYGDSVIEEEIKRCLSGGNRTVRFGCYRNSQSDNNFILISCLGRLTENLILAPFTFNAERVEILWPECGECPQGKCLSHIDGVLFFGKYLATMIGRQNNCIHVKNIRHNFQFKSAPLQLSRRDFFRKLRVETSKTITAFIPEFTHNQLNKPWSHYTGAKRIHLLKLLRAFPDYTSTVVQRGCLPVAKIDITHGCIGCPVCTTLCPTGALERVEKSGGVDIYFRPDICTGCQICQEACLFQSISLSQTVELKNLAIGAIKHIIHLEKKNCKECTTDFLGIEEEICPNCRHNKSDAMLSFARR